MEGRSLFRGAALLVALSVVRIGLDHDRARGPVLPDGQSDLPLLLEESRAVRDDQARRSAPMAPHEKLDPNRCGEEDLDRLPGIGPSTARAVVADREEKGGFTRPEDLLRVSGIGPAKVARITPYLDFSKGMPIELRRKTSGSGRARVVEDAATSLTPSQPSGSRPGSRTRIDLNRASLSELQSLPGIGPELAKRILDSRLRDGPFRGPDDLLRVRGIGTATVATIRALVVPGG